MGWASELSAATRIVALHKARRKQLEAYKQQRILAKRDSRVSTIAVISRGKCDSCGSSEFRECGDQTVCAYCRSAA